ncbi:MAG: orotate phosphoribosyltransferase, partial [Acidobacteria bacterium]|nr:orotate phosphoribosyltransferase [Acidobacteriota bacterium]
MDYAHQIAETLLDLNAVIVRPDHPFRWASGLLSPIYCDNRILISSVEGRALVQKAFQEKMKALNWQPNVIAGTATAGIPHAAWLAWLLELPMVYVRSAEKKHGQGKRIEGQLPIEARAVIVEDLISTGGSSLSTLEALLAENAQVLGILAIFEYGLPKAQQAFAQAHIAYASLTNLAVLAETLANRGALTGDQRAALENWRQDPVAWSEKR